MLSIKNLSFEYPVYDNEKPETVLKNISFEVKKGEFIAILGHNGCGKSTLAKMLNGILIPTDGDVFVNDFNTKNEEDLLKIRQTVGMVFQNPDNQIVATLVEEDVAFALENLGIPQPKMLERVKEALIAVNMYEYKNHATHRLSGGQKQRIAIAGVIAMRPDCIVLDEPTAMLDPVGRGEVMEILKKLNENFGINVIIITHYMKEAVQAKRVIVMDKGEILADSTPDIVFKQVEKLKNIGLDVPQVTELTYEAELELTVKEKECVDILMRLLERKI
jgi:energy-coupling factor transport system ATP-binding protein